MSDDVVLKIDLDSKTFTDFANKWNTFKKTAEKDTNILSKRIERIQKHWKKVQDTARGVFKAFSLVSLSIAGAVTGILAFVKAISSAVRKNFELAQGTKTTTKNVMSLQEAFRKSGIEGDAGSVLNSVRNMQMDERNKELLVRYNVDEKQDTTASFMELVDKITKSNMATALKIEDLKKLGLGEGSAQALLTNGGTERLKQGYAEAQRETSMNEGRARRLVAFDEQMERLKKVFQDLGMLLAEKLAPHLQVFAKWLSKIARESGDKIISGLVKGIQMVAQALGAFAKWLVKTFGKHFMSDKDYKEFLKNDAQNNPEYAEAMKAGAIDTSKDIDLQNTQYQFKKQLESPEQQQKNKEYMGKVKEKYAQDTQTANNPAGTTVIVNMNGEKVSEQKVATGTTNTAGVTLSPWMQKQLSRGI